MSDLPIRIWFGLTLDTKNEVVTVAAVGQDQAECHREAKARMPGLPVLCIDMAAGPAWRTGAKMASWFVEHGLTRREAAALVRKTARSVAKMMKKISREKGFEG